MSSIPGINTEVLIGSLKPYARKIQLGGAAGAVAGLFLMAGVPGFLQRFRWKVGLPLTVGSALAAYFGDKLLTATATTSKETIKQDLLDEGRDTPQKMTRGALGQEHTARLRKRIKRSTKDMPRVKLGYLLEHKKHRPALDLFARFDRWVDKVAQLDPEELLKLADEGSLEFKLEETTIFQVMRHESGGNKVFTISQPVTGTIDNTSTEEGGALVVHHKVAREHCEDEDTRCTINPEHLRKLMMNKLCKAWAGRAIVDILPQEGQWGVGVVMLEGTGVLRLGSGEATEEVRSVVKQLTFEKVIEEIEEESTSLSVDEDSEVDGSVGLAEAGVVEVELAVEGAPFKEEGLLAPGPFRGDLAGEVVAKEGPGAGKGGIEGGGEVGEGDLFALGSGEVAAIESVE